MNFTPLLLHSEAVPVEAKQALRAAYLAPAERRVESLKSAARILYQETDLDCSDVRDLIGLQFKESCG